MVWQKLSSIVVRSDSCTKAISYTPEGAVTISYRDLVSAPYSLTAPIGEFGEITVPWTLLIAQIAEQAFGSHPQSLGIIIVQDLPVVYNEYRERLLKLAYAFAGMDENVREKYTDAANKYWYAVEDIPLQRQSDL